MQVCGRTTRLAARRGLSCRAAAAALPHLASQRPTQRAMQRCTAGNGAAATAIDTSVPQGCRPGFSAPAGSDDGPDAAWACAIMGDLHLEPAQMPLFHAARDDLIAAMAGRAPGMEQQQQQQPHGSDAVAAGRARVVQLGDLGGYKHGPGTRECFDGALAYLEAFGAPFGLITGNHDLEGHTFDDDAANLASWRDAFNTRHYWAAELGPALLVGLSTVRFRSNAYSVHEVYVDDAQVAWFEALVAAHPGRPVIVFTHAPPVGSGLKVVQNVHVKNRCAWLNHSDRPERFIKLVERHNNIRAWFSGHFHLSQNYPDSISAVGRCAFVQTGVIGECNRDGFRQSRLLRVTRSGYQVLTVDHVNGGRARVDLEQRWDDVSTPVPITPPDELVCDPEAGWLCSTFDCALSSSLDGGDGDGAAAQQAATRWFPAGGDCLLAHVGGGLLVEYDAATRAPVGLVADATGKDVALVTASGGAPSASGDGADAAAVVLRDRATGEEQRLERNERGTFYRVFQPNKWLQKQVEARERAAAMAATAAAAASGAAQEVVVTK